jgi:hypothetical protein
MSKNEAASLSHRLSAQMVPAQVMEQWVQETQVSQGRMQCKHPPQTALSVPNLQKPRNPNTVIRMMLVQNLHFDLLHHNQFWLFSHLGFRP